VGYQHVDFGLITSPHSWGAGGLQDVLLISVGDTRILLDITGLEWDLKFQNSLGR
jgi:hypothetical protein